MAFCHLTRYYSNTMQYDKALEFICQAEQLNGKSFIVLRLKGIILQCLSQFDESKLVFQKALERNPQSSPTIMYFADLYQNMHNHKQRKELLDLAYKQSPRNMQVLKKLALFYIENDQCESALSYIRQMELINPNTPETVLSKLEFYLKLKQTHKLKEILEIQKGILDKCILQFYKGCFEQIS